MSSRLDERPAPEDRRGRSRSRSRSAGRKRDHSRDHSKDRHPRDTKGKGKERDHRHSRSPHTSRRGGRSHSRSPRRRHHSRSHSRGRHGGKHRRRSRSSSANSDHSKQANRSRDGRRRSRSTSSSSSDSSNDHRRRRRKEKHRRHRSKSRERDRKKRKREKREKRQKKKVGPAGHQWGKYGIINESDLYNKEPEFRAWLVEERKINPETISKEQTKKEFAHFAEDYNTATLPHEKFYHMEAYERRMSALRAGEFVPPADDSYDPDADLRALRSSHKRKAAETESFMSREQLQELRRVQNERIEAGKMKLLGMDIKQSMGVRYDGSTFDEV